MSRFSLPFPTVCRSFSPAGKARLLLGGVLLLIVVFLFFAEKPWEIAGAIEARKEAGKNPLYTHDVTVGLYWAAVLNAALTAVLLVTASWWARATGSGEEWSDRAAGDCPGTRIAPRVFVGVLCGIVLLGGVLRWNLAQRSLWWDELWSVKQVIAGNYAENEDGTRGEFRRATISRSLWYYGKPTNHVVSSFLSNVSVRVWRTFRGDDKAPHEVSDFAVRFSHFTASLLAVAGVGVLLRQWGLALSGLTAAALLAVHPWHVRYGVDARAYSHIVFLVVAACLCLTLIYQSNRERWWPWVGFGFCQFLLAWSYPAMVWVNAALALAGVCLVVMRWKSTRARAVALLRLVAVNVFAGMAFIQVFAPNVIQMGRWYSQMMEEQPHLLNAAVLRDIGSYLLLGMRWANPGVAGAEAIPSLQSLAASAPLHVWTLGPLFVLLALLGAIALRHRAGLAILIGALVFAGAVHLGFSFLTDQIFYQRFVIYLVVPLVCLLGLGVERLGERRRAGPAGDAAEKVRPGQWAVAGLVVALFAALVSPQLKVLTTRPYAPMRDVIEFVRGRGRGEHVLLAGYGLGGDVLPVYDPECRVALGANQIRALAREAGEAGRELYLCCGYDNFNRYAHPDGFPLIDSPEWFEEVARFAGIDPDMYFRVLRYRGDDRRNGDGG